MKNIVFGAAVSAVLLGQAVWAGNPILRKDDPGFLYAPDPAAEVFNGKVYVYCSRDQPTGGGFGGMQDYMILETTDMENWINHGVVLRPRVDEGFEYASGQMNAPDAAFKDGWYYWYFPYEKTYVGVAKSRTPVGPWESAIAGTLEEGKDAAVSAIFDPTVFVDDDGQAYIYGNDLKVGMGTRGPHMMGAKLKDNMVELDGPWFELSKETVWEGVHIFKREGVYYFMARDKNRTVYFTADNPLPYAGNPDNLKTPMFSDSDGLAKFRGAITLEQRDAPPHPSAVEYKGQWYFFYHRGDVNDGRYSRRSACVDKMYFNDDGTIQLVDFTLEQPDTSAHGEGALHREAEAYSAESGTVLGISGEACGTSSVDGISAGDWTLYEGLDFGTDPRAEIPFYVRTACDRKGSGTIELRLDGPGGKLLDEIPVESTGGWTNYKTLSTSLSGLSGKQTLCMVYSGGSEDLNFQVNWFEWMPEK